MIKILGIALALAAFALSMNTGDATERTAKLSGNSHAASQLEALDSEGY